MPVSKNKIEVEIRATALGFKKASKNLEAFGNKVQGLGKALAVAGGIGTAAIGAIIKKSAAFGDDLDKTSIRLGINVEHLSQLAFAAQQTGSSFQGVQVGFKRLTVAAKDADDGLLESVRYFEELGVEIHDTNGNLRDAYDLFLDSAEAISQLESRTEAAAIAQKIFGRGGLQMLPLLLQGKKGIKELSDESDRLGGTWTKLATDHAMEVTDALGRVKTSLSGVGREIFTVAAPAIQELANKFAKELVPKASLWINEHRTITKGLLMLGPSSLVLGGALTGVTALAFAFNQLALAMNAVAGTKIVGFLSKTSGLLLKIGGPLAAVAIALKGASKVESGTLAPQSNAEVARQMLAKDQPGISSLDELFSEKLRLFGGGGQRRAGIASEDTAALAASNANKQSRFAQAVDILKEAGPEDRGGLLPAPGAKPGAFAIGDELPSQPLAFDQQGGLGAAMVQRINESQAVLKDFDSFGGVFAQNMIGRFSEIGDAIGDTFSDGIMRGKLSIKDFGQAFKQVFADIIGQLVAAIAKFLIFKLVLSFIPGGSGLGFSFKDLFSGSFNRGGIVGFARGGVQGRDSLLGLLTPGEAVLPKPLVDRLMDSGGGALAGGFQQVVIQPTFFMGTESELLEIERKLNRAHEVNETGVSF